MGGRSWWIVESEWSNTFQRPDGSLESVFSPSPVNYLDARGAWQPVDNTLVDSGAGWVNRANRFSVSVPKQATGQVAVSSGSSRVAFELFALVLGRSSVYVRSVNVWHEEPGGAMLVELQRAS